MNLFLDLEGTLIDDLENANLLWENVHKIKEFIHNQRLASATIFSFGLLNNTDFSESLKSELESILGISLNVVSKQDIMAKVLADICLNEFDFTTIFGKDMAFVHFIRKTEKEGTFLLVDDVPADTWLDLAVVNTQTHKRLSIAFTGAKSL